MNPLPPAHGDTNLWLPLRIVMLAAALLAGFGVVGWRLYDLQVVRHEDALRRVQENRRIIRAITALRGTIYDRNSDVIAQDKPAYDVWINTQRTRAFQDVKVQLAKIENVKEEPLLASGTKDQLVDRYVSHVAGVLAEAFVGQPDLPKQEEILRQWAEEWKAKRVEFPVTTGLSGDEADRWKKLLVDGHVLGVSLRSSARRFYANDHRLTHVLGFVNHEHRGMEGIEKTMNQELAGEDGAQDIKYDHMGFEVPVLNGETKERVTGHKVWLTIDMQLQDMLENQLEVAAEKYKPKKVTSVIVEPKTGAILAMSSRPLFEHGEEESKDPKVRHRGHVAVDEYERSASPAIAQPYEPGSVFKLVTFAGVFDRNLASLNDSINCDRDQKVLANLHLQDHVSGKVTVAQVLSHSSNIGSYLLARRLGVDSFLSYVDRFGFGKPTHVSLSGEKPGQVPKHPEKNATPKKMAEWDGLTFSRMVIGHSIEVTPLQMVMAASAIANKGALMKPQIVRKVCDVNGQLLQEYAPERVNQVCSPQAAALVAKAMEGVVTDPHGTGKNAQIPGVRVAGKTGTSQRRSEDGPGYDKGRYAVTFVGFAPVEDPQFCIIVVIDDPHAPEGELTGGTLAAPIFAQIMKESLIHNTVMARRVAQTQTQTVGKGGGR